MRLTAFALALVVVSCSALTAPRSLNSTTLAYVGSEHGFYATISEGTLCFSAPQVCTPIPPDAQFTNNKQIALLSADKSVTDELVAVVVFVSERPLLNDTAVRFVSRLAVQSAGVFNVLVCRAGGCLSHSLPVGDLLGLYDANIIAVRNTSAGSVEVVISTSSFAVNSAADTVSGLCNITVGSSGVTAFCEPKWELTSQVYKALGFVNFAMPANENGGVFAFSIYMLGVPLIQWGVINGRYYSRTALVGTIYVSSPLADCAGVGVPSLSQWDAWTLGHANPSKKIYAFKLEAATMEAVCTTTCAFYVTACHTLVKSPYVNETLAVDLEGRVVSVDPAARVRAVVSEPVGALEQQALRAASGRTLWTPAAVSIQGNGTHYCIAVDARGSLVLVCVRALEANANAWDAYGLCNEQIQNACDAAVEAPPSSPYPPPPSPSAQRCFCPPGDSPPPPPEGVGQLGRSAILARSDQCPPGEKAKIAGLSVGITAIVSSMSAFAVAFALGKYRPGNCRPKKGKVADTTPE